MIVGSGTLTIDWSETPSGNEEVTRDVSDTIITKLDELLPDVSADRLIDIGRELAPYVLARLGRL